MVDIRSWDPEMEQQGTACGHVPLMASMGATVPDEQSSMSLQKNTWAERDPVDVSLLHYSVALASKEEKMSLQSLAVADEAAAERDSVAEGQRVDEEQSSASEAVVVAVEMTEPSGLELIPFLNTYHPLTPPTHSSA